MMHDYESINKGFGENLASFDYPTKILTQCQGPCRGKKHFKPRPQTGSWGASFSLVLIC